MQRGKQTNYGIEALRILSVLMITVLHLLVIGGGIDAVKGTSTYYVYVVVKYLFLCAIDCFGLITGYVHTRCASVSKPSKLFRLWSVVLFYSVAGWIFFCLFSKDAGSVWKYLLPVLHNYNWYFTGFFLMYLLSPFLNLMIQTMNKAGFQAYLLTLIGISLISTAASEDLFFLNYGYSPLWLILLYVLGGGLARFGSEQVLFWRHGRKGFCLTAIAAVLFEFLLNYKLHMVTFAAADSIFMLLLSVYLLSVFSSANLKGGSRLLLFSNAVFGQYIIQVHPLIYNNWISGIYNKPVFNALPVGWRLPFDAILLYFILLAVELGRQLLFRATHLDGVISRAGKGLDGFFSHMKHLIFGMENENE